MGLDHKCEKHCPHVAGAITLDCKSRSRTRVRHRVNPDFALVGQLRFDSDVALKGFLVLTQIMPKPRDKGHVSQCNGSKLLG